MTVTCRARWYRDEPNSDAYMAIAWITYPHDVHLRRADEWIIKWKTRIEF